MSSPGVSTFGLSSFALSSRGRSSRGRGGRYCSMVWPSGMTMEVCGFPPSSALVPRSTGFTTVSSSRPHSTPSFTEASVSGRTG
ncbi:MAG: hypothetical protein HZB26_01015 [Candidatus Hydrogenedentes bacterium]|nr:hypothetical protein [Candidatus Hydrogenedentota bacterium]